MYNKKRLIPELIFQKHKIWTQEKFESCCDNNKCSSISVLVEKQTKPRHIKSSEPEAGSSEWILNPLLHLPLPPPSRKKGSTVQWRKVHCVMSLTRLPWRVVLQGACSIATASWQGAESASQFGTKIALGMSVGNDGEKFQFSRISPFCSASFPRFPSKC